MASDGQRNADKVQTEAKKTLSEVGKTFSSPFGSQLADAANRARDHFGAADGDQDDRVEVWGRRIARLAALAFVIWLIFSLVNESHFLTR